MYIKQHVDLNSLHDEKVGILRIDDTQYPKQLSQILGNKSPKELYFLGNLRLLKKHSVGFCGSRKATDKGLETAKDCAEQMAKNGIVVISGNANGIDIAAHHTVLKEGGETIVVLPEGIDNFKIKPALQEVWDWSRVLVISQFKPSDIWKPFRAMSRNSIIIALSKAMIVIEAQEKGGTIEAGKSTLKLKIPLFVAQYESKKMQQTPGNIFLINHGAHSLKKSKSIGRAKLGDLFEKIKKPFKGNNSAYTQASFL